MPSRLLLTFLIFALSLPFPSFAEDGDSGYWENLKNKLAHISPQKKGAATTAVGGIRGSKGQSADTLYWKGEEEIVAAEEYARFQEAYQAAVDGKKKEAVTKFEAFLKDFPQSTLGEDARLALQELQQP
jgi:TolA-binding protein